MVTLSQIFERHILKYAGQKSVTDFVRRIRDLQRDKDIPLVLAYGAWANVAVTYVGQKVL